MNKRAAPSPSSTLPRSLQELEAALGPELEEITRRHRIETQRWLTHQAEALAARRAGIESVGRVLPRVFCTGRARRPGASRRASSMACASGDDDGGGEPDPVAVAAAAVPTSSPFTSNPIEHKARRLPGHAFQEIA